jgi:hypothetical protein
MAPRTRRVTASQVGQYAFCARAWWLGTVEKREPAHHARLDAGQEMHERHGWNVALARVTRRLALLLTVSAALGLVVWALFALYR